MCKNLTKIVDGFLSSLSLLRGTNLVIELTECYEVIKILYMQKTCWCVYDGIDVRDVGMRLEQKGSLGGRILCEEGATIEVSAGMCGGVILAGNSQGEKTIW